MGIYHGSYDGANAGICNWILPVHDENQSAGYILTIDYSWNYDSGCGILYETVYGGSTFQRTCRGSQN